MRISTTDRRGWTTSRTSRFGRRAVLLLLVLTTFGGLFTSATPGPARADELSDAYKKQQALQRLIKRQKLSIESLTANQAILARRISSTKGSLAQTQANLLAVKTQIVSMVVDVARSQNAVDELVAVGGRLDAELLELEAEAAAKATDLEESKVLLATRIREAYETDRTSMIDTFLSGKDFTDVLTEASYHLEFAEQDKILADKIVADQKVLEVLHENVALARQQTQELHVLAADARAALDQQMKELNETRKELARLEAETKRLLAEQQAAFAKLAADKQRLARQLAENKEAQQNLENLIDKLVREQFAKGGIPSVYNGTFRWPMAGRVTQEFGCTGFGWEPSYGGCNHFHRGIDVANQMYTPIYAAGHGKVIFAGRSPWDPAWIVIVAHSQNLVTWYGHVDNRSHPPVVREGDFVAEGQLLAYNGLTGYTTGPHLHWAVQLDGTWVNPRLFLPR